MPETWRKKHSSDYDSVTVEKYLPPLDRLAHEQLAALARTCDPDADVAEVVFRSGRRVLLVRWQDGDHGRNESEYVTVEPGNYLAHGTSYGRLLYESDDADLNGWYERAEAQ